MRLNLHGVVRAGHRLPKQAGVRLVVWEDLALVVSAHPEGRVGEPEALRHLEMLCELVKTGPVVPLRWGTTAPDDESARAEAIRPLATHLRAELDRLDGAVEAHVYLRFDEQAALRAVAGEPDRWTVARGATLGDRIKVGEAIARRVVAWRQERAQELLTPLIPYAREVEALPDRDHVEDRRAFLLPHEVLPAARQAVVAIDAENVVAEFVAPLPAFTFLHDVPRVRKDREQASRWGW